MSSPAPQSPAPVSPAQDSAFLIRMVVLVLVLLISVGALAFDRISWNEAKSAYDLVMNLPKDEKYVKAPITQDDIHKALNRKPTLQRDGEMTNTVEEVFQWQHGMPMRTYDVIVVYSKGNNDRLLFSTVYSEGIEAAGEEPLPPIVAPTTETPVTPPPGPPPSRGGTERPPMEEPKPMPEPSTEPDTK